MAAHLPCRCLPWTFARQGPRYDPHGKLVARWCPELKWLAHDMLLLAPPPADDGELQQQQQEPSHAAVAMHLAHELLSHLEKKEQQVLHEELLRVVPAGGGEEYGRRSTRPTPSVWWPVAPLPASELAEQVGSREAPELRHLVRRFADTLRARVVAAELGGVEEGALALTYALLNFVR